MLASIWNGIRLLLSGEARNAKSSFENDLNFNFMKTIQKFEILSLNREVEVSAMPKEFSSWIERLGLNKPTYCYHNCFMTVFNGVAAERKDLSYVLGWVIHESDQIKVRHAWLKYGEKYHDPTLEPQQLLSGATYILNNEFSFPELSKMLLDRFGEDRVRKMMNGEERWWPLMMTDNGYEFFDGPNG